MSHYSRLIVVIRFCKLFQSTDSKNNCGVLKIYVIRNLDPMLQNQGFITTRFGDILILPLCLSEVAYVLRTFQWPSDSFIKRSGLQRAVLFKLFSLTKHFKILTLDLFLVVLSKPYQHSKVNARKEVLCALPNTYKIPSETCTGCGITSHDV